jgi:hypothetical protein
MVGHGLSSSSLRNCRLVLSIWLSLEVAVVVALKITAQAVAVVVLAGIAVQ